MLKPPVPQKHREGNASHQVQSALAQVPRLRSLQYLPYLQAAGIDVTVCPLFDDGYLERLYAGRGRSIGSVALRYGIRARSLRRAGGTDLLWIEKEALPYLPYWIERALMPSGVPYVVDYDDAVFHNYDLSGRSWVRDLLGRKIDGVMAGAAAVICGNDYLAERARKAGAVRIELVPTVVDVDRYCFPPQSKNSGLVIGLDWVARYSTIYTGACSGAGSPWPQTCGAAGFGWRTSGIGRVV